MALQAQGRLPKLGLCAKHHGINENGDYTANSVEYRGRPYSSANATDMSGIDMAKELTNPSIQQGFRAIAAYLRTGQQEAAS